MTGIKSAKKAIFVVCAFYNLCETSTPHRKTMDMIADKDKCELVRMRIYGVGGGLAKRYKK